MLASRTLNAADAAIVRALIAQGIAQHDVASLLGCNPGRIAEINTGARLPGVPAADLADPAVRARVATILVDHSLRMARQLRPLLNPASAP